MEAVWDGAVAEHDCPGCVARAGRKCYAGNTAQGDKLRVVDGRWPRTRQFSGRSILQRSRPVSGRRRDDSRGCVRGGGYSVGVSVDWGTVAAAVAGSGITSAVLTHVLTFKRDSTTWERQERVRLEGLRREAFADFIAECDGLANAAGSLPQPLTPEKIRSLQAGPERARARLALVTDSSEIMEGADKVVSNAIMRAATESSERSTLDARVTVMTRYVNSRFRLVDLMRDELGRLAPETPSGGKGPAAPEQG